jgi:hypothetical protein
MTPKGHQAVAAALAGALREGPPAKAPGPLVALAEGRSRPPPPEAWGKAPSIAVLGSEGCEAKKIREWLYVRCAPWNAHAPKITALEVARVGLGEAMAVVTAEGAATLVAPAPPGADLEAVFGWEGRPRKLVVRWDRERIVPDMSFADAAGFAPRPVDAAGRDELCACHQRATGRPTCASMVAAPDADCQRTFAGDCARLLACAAGDPARAPRCPAGHVNAGAALHCSKLCAADAECGAGASCVEDQGVRRCVPR